MRKMTWAVLGLALVAGGCGGEEAEVEQTEPVTLEPAAPAAPATAPAGGGMEMAVNLQPLNESGVTGQATVSPGSAESDTQVMVMLSAGAGGSTHQGHIHQGTCESLGSVVQPLQPVTLDGNGSGTMTSTVSVPLSTVMNGQHIVVYHEAGGNPGAPVVCGQIPQHSM